MASVTNLIVLLLLCLAGSLLICVSSSEQAFVSHDLHDAQLTEDTQSILNKHGFDQPLLKYYWRRAMLVNDPMRVFLHKFFCLSLSTAVNGLPSSSLAVTPTIIAFFKHRHYESSPSSNADTITEQMVATGASQLPP
ncbi:hypothetical protein L1987_14696 [Smallanthus sonchifolius]|uniref:Uncharacterized protein n=1 Tax=Smallanthus sonchifolius TaxID=185202 RepID=A0ACB9J4C8_9ASTR|nr:hypothetical protein L1987_14696 [Smallanthus sonchifolius]